MKGTWNFSSFKTRQPSHLYISNLNRTEMSQNELPLHLRSWIFILCFKYLNKKQYLIFACESKKVNVKGYFKEKIFEKYIQCECQQPRQHDILGLLCFWFCALGHIYFCMYYWYARKIMLQQSLQDPSSSDG